MCKKSETKREYTLSELSKYSHQNVSPDGRILTAVEGKVREEERQMAQGKYDSPFTAYFFIFSGLI